RARLAGWTITIPPLVLRREDILPLAQAFLRRTSRAQLTSDAAEALLLHPWPRNVRELEQTMQAAAVRAGGGWHVTLAHLPESIGASVQQRPKRAGARDGKPSDTQPSSGTPPLPREAATELD